MIPRSIFGGAAALHIGLPVFLSVCPSVCFSSYIMVFIIILMITVINQIFDNIHSIDRIYSGLLFVMFVEKSLAIGYGTFHIC